MYKLYSKNDYFPLNSNVLKYKTLFKKRKSVHPMLSILMAASVLSWLENNVKFLPYPVRPSNNSLKSKSVIMQFNSLF